jgi:hypothetical protein
MRFHGGIEYKGIKTFMPWFRPDAHSEDIMNKPSKYSGIEAADKRQPLICSACAQTTQDISHRRLYWGFLGFGFTEMS